MDKYPGIQQYKFRVVMPGRAIELSFSLAVFARIVECGGLHDHVDPTMAALDPFCHFLDVSYGLGAGYRKVRL